MNDIRVIDNDMTFDDMVEGVDEIIQTIKAELLTVLGEWLLDESQGLNKDAVLGRVSAQGACTEVARVIGNEPRIELTSAVSVDYEPTTRLATFRFTARKLDDNEIIEMEVAQNGVDIARV